MSNSEKGCLRGFWWEQSRFSLATSIGSPSMRTASPSLHRTKCVRNLRRNFLSKLLPYTMTHPQAYPLKPDILSLSGNYQPPTAQGLLNGSPSTCAPMAQSVSKLSVIVLLNGHSVSLAASSKEMSTALHPKDDD